VKRDRKVAKNTFQDFFSPLRIQWMFVVSGNSECEQIFVDSKLFNFNNELGY
jgi:hypothetical protein